MPDGKEPDAAPEHVPNCFLDLCEAWRGLVLKGRDSQFLYQVFDTIVQRVVGASLVDAQGRYKTCPYVHNLSKELVLPLKTVLHDPVLHQAARQRVYLATINIY